VLALRDYYLEKLTLEADGVPPVVDLERLASDCRPVTITVTISNSTNPDAWAIKYIDVIWVQPLLGAFDDSFIADII
jgi:hypothetical protein